MEHLEFRGTHGPGKIKLLDLHRSKSDNRRDDDWEKRDQEGNQDLGFDAEAEPDDKQRCEGDFGNDFGLFRCDDLFFHLV